MSWDRRYFFLVLTLLLSACDLLQSQSALRSEMPSNNAPLNAVIVLSYTGENYVNTSQIQPGLIEVTTCKSPDLSFSDPKPEDPNAPKKEGETTKKDEPKPVTGYTYLFGREKDGRRVSYLVFIPSAADSEHTPLEPDQDYCISVQDLKDDKGTLIPGTASNPIRIRTQSAQSGDSLFHFESALDTSFDLEGATDQAKTAYVLSSLEEQGKEEDGHRVIHPNDLTMFYTGKAVHPSSLISGSFVCEEREKENKTEQSDCQGWAKLNLESSFLVESLKPDADGWVRARYNQYALWRSFSAGTQYYWRIGLKGAKNAQMFGVIPNVRFTVSETASKAPADRYNKAFWKNTLNKIYQEANIDLSLKESDPLFFIPITQN